jgi:hypothetical protein
MFHWTSMKAAFSSTTAHDTKQWRALAAHGCLPRRMTVGPGCLSVHKVRHDLIFMAQKHLVIV